MDFEAIEVTDEIKALLKLEDKSKMIKSNRTVRMNPGNEILYFLEFYCSEKLSRIGVHGYV